MLLAVTIYVLSDDLAGRPLNEAGETRPVWPLIRVKHVPKKLLDFFDKDSL
jgi:hypothetical protein